MKNILLCLSLTLCILNPIIVKAQPFSQKEKVEISKVISAYVPGVYNNRYTPCLLEEIYNKLEGENGLTQEERMFIVKEHRAYEINESIDLLNNSIDIAKKIKDISKSVVKNSSCYSK